VNRPPRLMLVTNRLATRRPLLDVIRGAVAGGVDTVQVREKDLDSADLLELARRIRDAASPANAVVNGSIEIARRLGIGVHLPEAGPTIQQARAVLGSKAMIGRSVHSIETAMASDGADYVIVGHVFTTVSKPGVPPLGLEGLSAIVQASPVPVIAIGGIDRNNARQVIAAGAKGVAVMSAINQSDDPYAEAAAIRTELGGADVPITLNGRETSVGSSLTIQDFLNQRGFKDRLVVVEINGKIAAKSSYSVRVFEPEDSVEIVHFVGGG
jgi:thiamine-phosphate pyrophosphorylase